MKKYLLLGISFLILSSSGVFLKLASMHDFLSPVYLFYLGMTLFVMAVYAVLWQQVLTMIPLNRAYLCKSCTIGISLMYAYLIFGEEISVQNLLGCLLIVAGIMVLSYKNESAA